MSLKNRLVLFLANEEKSLQEIYPAFPTEKQTTIRGRINEAIDKYFKRIRPGVYTSILGKYQVIYADPAWKYSNKKSNGAANNHYDVMSMKEIKELPVKDLCKNDAVLFLWSVPPLLREALDVMKSWGFQYKTVAFVWIKLNSDGRPFKGLGNFTRSNAELCLLGIKKKGLKVKSHKISQVIQTAREIHSKKPCIVYSHIEELYGNVERLELFARDNRINWDAWGNELRNDKQNTL